MMSLWDASIETANRWYDIAWYGLLASGLVTALAAVATVGFLLLQFWSSSIRDKYTELRTSALEVQSKRALADLAAAQANIADANARALEAQAALAKYKAPRTLTPEQQAKISDKLKRFGPLKFDAGVGPKGDPEPLYILRNIFSSLISAGWVQIPWTGGGETYTDPPMLAVGLSSVTNVIVDVHPDYWAKYGAAAQALADALRTEGIDAIADSKPTSINNDAIHLRIGRKL
jgi:hypothetical protein